jgi:hypothetical protein
MRTIIHYLGLCAVIAFVNYSWNSSDPHWVTGQSIIVGFGLGTIAFVYFLPTYIAFRRGHSNAVGIAIFNVFLGWTLVTWVWALIAACANCVTPVVEHHHYHVAQVNHVARTGPTGPRTGPWDRHTIEG